MSGWLPALSPESARWFAVCFVSCSLALSVSGCGESREFVEVRDSDDDAGTTKPTGGRGGSERAGRGGSLGPAGAYSGQTAAVGGGGSSGIAGQKAQAGGSGGSNGGTVEPGGPKVCADAPGVHPPPTQGNFIALQSECGDFIGQGKRYLYTNASAVIEVNVYSSYIAVDVKGNETWDGRFAGKMGESPLDIGEYTGLQRWPFHNAEVGGLDWGGQSRGCNRLTASMNVTAIQSTDDVITGFELSFEQHCESNTAALFGQIRWYAADE